MFDDVPTGAARSKTSVGKFDKKVLRERFKDHKLPGRRARTVRPRRDEGAPLRIAYTDAARRQFGPHCPALKQTIPAAQYIDEEKLPVNAWALVEVSTAYPVTTLAVAEPPPLLVCCAWGV